MSRAHQRFPIAHPVEQLRPPHANFRIRPRSDGAYEHRCNLVFAETDGVGLTLDVFIPPESNGCGVVDVVAGAWHSDRARLNEHLGLGLIDVLAARGFTTFAVRPGSATLFTARQMKQHVDAAIRWVKLHAGEFGIEPGKLALAGASAGGHIAALCALQPSAARHASRERSHHLDTKVAAALLIFAPSDLEHWSNSGLDRNTAGRLPLDRLLFSDGVEGRSESEIQARLRELSPVQHVTSDAPPFYLLHGTADDVVPHQQSELLARRLKAANVEVKLHLHTAGAHPWPTIRNELEQAAEWLHNRS